MNEEHYNMLYARAKEVQPNLKMLIQDFKATGMSDEEIELEIAFTLIHDGYRLRDIETQIQELQNEHTKLSKNDSDTTTANTVHIYREDNAG